MPKETMLIVRCDNSLKEMIKATGIILDRKESETIRILLTRACKYWILKARMNNSLPSELVSNPEISKVKLSDTTITQMDLEIKQLEEGMKNLK